MIFWLSERKNKRESDATALLKSGFGIRFDIGFIGKGNPEISLDKVSRFERSLERAGTQHNLITIILVDTIGANSKIMNMAREIGGYLLQMSRTYWVRELAAIIKQNFTFYQNPLLKLPPAASTAWIKKNASKLNLNIFL